MTTRTAKRTRNALYALAVSGALGFGATQVAAAPGPAAEGEARACTEQGCRNQCRAVSAFDGRCYNGQCLCLY